MQRDFQAVDNGERVNGMEILVIEDNPDFRELLSVHLAERGFAVTVSDEIPELEPLIGRHNFGMILLDLWLGKYNGLELLPKIVRMCPRVPIVILSGDGSTENAATAVRRGARGFISKSGDFKGLVQKVCTYLDEPCPQIDSGLDELPRKCGLIGTHPSMLSLVERIFRVSDVDSTVLVTGESGTGKELVARALHNNSKRRTETFRAINCGAIPAGLLESQLFGHRRGSFTDAKTDQKGMLEVCSGGTLLLDEIGEMPIELQVKLLRCIQEREVFPVGATQPVKINTRIVAATNKQLEKEIAEKRFREDLYFRLCVLSIKVPPLRERKSDIPLLVEEFISRFNRVFEKGVAFPGAEVLSRLESYNWPGNVRELQNFIERGIVLAKANELELQDLFESTALASVSPSSFNDAGSPGTLKRARDEFIAGYLHSLLRFSKGNISRAADVAGCHRVELHRLIRKHHVDAGEFRPN